MYVLPLSCAPSHLDSLTGTFVLDDTLDFDHRAVRYGRCLYLRDPHVDPHVDPSQAELRARDSTA